MQQLDRNVIIQIGELNNPGLEISNFRITFNIDKSSTVDSNKAKVEIFNLSPATRDQIETINDDISGKVLASKNLLIVKAGYRGFEKIAFIGNITLTSVDIKRPDSVTTIEAKDGIIGINSLKLSVGYAAGVSAKKVLKDTIAKTVFSKSNIAWNKITDRQYPRGFSFQGDAGVLIDNVTNYLGCYWSIQNNEMVIKNSKGGRLGDVEVASINPTNGLIGSPEKLHDVSLDVLSKLSKTQKKARQVTTANGKKTKSIIGGVKVKCLLRPEVCPGNVIELESEHIDKSFFRVVEVSHIGDNFGPDWTTEMTTIGADLS